MNNKQIGLIPLGNNDSIIKTNKHEVCQHEVFLDEEIGEPAEYRELLSLLFNASEDDQFTFYINTPGGQLNSTRAIIEGMKHTQAMVTGVLMGETHSGGSLIAMYCHGLAVLDSAEMMIHHANIGSIGTANNVKTQSNFTVSQVESLIDESYEGFLTVEEMKDVKKGVELWFNAKQIRSRMEKRVKVLEEKLVKAAKPKRPAKPKKVEPVAEG